MSGVRVVPAAAGPLRGSVRVPGDKSIAHRAVLFNAAAEGTATVSGLPGGQDVASSVAAMRRLGADIERIGNSSLRIRGRALGFARDAGDIDCGNSGTTMRLLCGLLAGQEGLVATLCGDASLSRRPMQRVAAPLAALGASVETTDGHAPLRVRGAGLHGARVALPVASAQLKSAVLLAGLQADGRTEVLEPVRTRDHTEKLLAAMGVAVDAAGTTCGLSGPAIPRATDVEVPGDPSSAAFLLVAAVLVPGSEVTVDGLCLNPTRTGFLEVLRRMGADLEVRVDREQGGEPVGSVRCRASQLRAFEVGADEVPAAIDELPLLAVAAAFANGVTTISGAAELRVKESDRIATTASLLKAFGTQVEVKDDGMLIQGGRPGGGGRIDAAGDHRIAMAAAVAALAAGPGGVSIDGAAAVDVSFPEFFETLGKLGRSGGQGA